MTYQRLFASKRWTASPWPPRFLRSPLKQVSITAKRLQDVELQQRTRAAQKIQAAAAAECWNVWLISPNNLW